MRMYERLKANYSGVDGKLSFCLYCGDVMRMYDRLKAHYSGILKYKWEVIFLLVLIVVT